jgi:hypothetical protein
VRIASRSAGVAPGGESGGARRGSAADAVVIITG